MSRPIKYKAKVNKLKKLTWKIMYLELDLVEPSVINFRPGQFVSIQVAQDTYRAYSIASGPNITDRIEILVEYAHDGVGAKYFKGLAVGDLVIFVGPSGKFILREHNDETLYFFATGSGIAPFIPMFDKLGSAGYRGKIRLFFGIRYLKDSFYLDRLDRYKELLKNFDYKVYVSRPEENIPDQFTKGRINSVVESVADDDARYYLCGNPLMVEDVFGKLVSHGVNEEKIYTEEFTHN